jgi:hypothetical protein
MGSLARLLPLLVLAVAAGCASPAAELAEEPAGSVATAITTSPSSTEGAQDGHDERSTRTNDADRNGRGRLAVTDNYVEIGAAFANENVYSFGATSPGSTTTRTLAVGAAEEATVSSVSVISETGAFRIVKDGCTGVRLTGSECRVTVAATPPDEGEHRGVLVIRNSLADTSLDLAVRAEGSAPEQNGSAAETTEQEAPPTTSG